MSADSNISYHSPMNRLARSPLQHCLAVSLLGLHLLLSGLAACHLSPTWDEINYPFSGYVHLKTGSLEFFPQNPFLSRIIYGATLFFIKQNPEPSFDSIKRSNAPEAGYRFF